MIGIIGWLMALLLGVPLGMTATSTTTFTEDSGSESGPTETSGPMLGAEGPVATAFFRSVPADCGFVADFGAAPGQSSDPGAERAWSCLEQQRDAGLPGQLMSFDDQRGQAGPTYYRVTADGQLEVYTDAGDGSDLSVVRCPAPPDLARGCR